MTTQPTNLPTSPAASRDRRLAVGLFFLVLAVYTLTYAGAFKSNDERALFSGTDSFFKRGEFTVNQIYWDYTNVGMLTSAGDMVPNYEPAQMVAALPFYLWGRLLGAMVQGTMFFGVFVAAASVALLYLCLLELGVSRRASLLGGLVFAFATMLWPYSRTFFREPLTVLAYLIAIYGMLRYHTEPARLWWPALVGAGLGLALTTKQISVAIVPSLLLLAFVYERQRPSTAGIWRQRALAVLAAVIPLAAFLLLQGVYRSATLSGVELFARDLGVYISDPQLSQSVPIRMARALLGLSISPYKGVFWYSPVLLLGLVGTIPFLRRWRWEGIAFLLLIGVHFLGYSRYNYWSGGVAWGSRYMLPIVPFLVVLAAPVWVWLVDPRQAPGRRRPLAALLRIGAWLLIVLSTFVQVLGVSIDLRKYELDFLLTQSKVWGGIGQAIEALYLRPGWSPVVGHLRLLLAGETPLDFAWVQLREQGGSALAPMGLILSLLLAALGIVALVWVWRRPEHAGRVGLVMTMVMVIGGSLLLTVYRHGDARFDPYSVDRFLRPMIADLAKRPCGWQGCNEALIVPDPVLTDYFLNYMTAPLVWYTIDPSPVDTDLLKRMAARYGVIWLGRDRNVQTDESENRRGYERYLTLNTYKAGEQQFENWARLLQYSAAGAPVLTVAPRQTLGDMVLEKAMLSLQRRPLGQPVTAPGEQGEIRAHAGDVLQVSLEWRATETPQGNYTVFVQLLDTNNQVVGQNDHWPAQGEHPTAGLSAGQTVTDNVALPLDLPPGDYRLITGLYRGDVEGYPRLSGPGGDFAMVGRVRVQETAAP